MIAGERSSSAEAIAEPTHAVAPRHRPRWRQIEAALESRIRGGGLAPGERLPTEGQLSQEFHVHRHTIGRALERLRERGLLRSEQGCGVFVREPALTYRLGRSSRLSEAAQWQRRAHNRQILESGPVRADRSAARALGLLKGQLVCQVEALRLIDDKPFAITTYFFPLPRFEGVDGAIRETGSIASAMELYGIPLLVRSTLSIRASLPTSAAATLLGVGRNKPLLELTNVNVDSKGKPVQLTRSRVNSAWLNLEIEFRD